MAAQMAKELFIARACVLSYFSHVLLFATAWTVACQAPLVLGFPMQEYWSGCNVLLQGLFLTQGSNLCLLHCRQILDPLSYLGSPLIRALSS